MRFLEEIQLKVVKTANTQSAPSCLSTEAGVTADNDLCFLHTKCSLCPAFLELIRRRCPWLITALNSGRPVGGWRRMAAPPAPPGRPGSNSIRRSVAEKKEWRKVIIRPSHVGFIKSRGPIWDMSVPLCDGARVSAIPSYVCVSLVV